jgi:uncharacterized protein (DUF2235 family)
MAKNIVVCCDGTSNQFSSARTNVAKLCLALQQAPGQQEVFYHPGLGTMEPPGALTGITARITRLLGLAVGYGLQNDIRDAYVFLMNTFESGDQVFVFGFSRGAYTAKALTALLHMYGLLRRGNDALVPYAIRMMGAVNNLPENGSASSKAAVDEIWNLAREFKRTFSVDCKPAFVGLWDTVSSVGLLSRPFHAPYTANNPDIAVARHALSIDEHRGFFRPGPWFPKVPFGSAESGPKDLVQVWFPGDHSDVGGGYPEAESGLAKGALKWMVCEAAAHGLLFDPQRVREVLGIVGTDYIAPNPNAVLHNSLTGFWRVLEFVPKKSFDAVAKRWKWRINRFRHRDIPADALVHESAFARGDSYRKWFPAGARKAETIRAEALGL